MLQYINVIANLFIMANYFNELCCYTTGYVNWPSSGLKCGTRHRGYPGTGIMEGDCTHNPEDWNNKSIT